MDNYSGFRYHKISNNLEDAILRLEQIQAQVNLRKV